jgi:hypothetical protein
MVLLQMPTFSLVLMWMLTFPPLVLLQMPIFSLVFLQMPTFLAGFMLMPTVLASVFCKCKTKCRCARTLVVLQKWHLSLVLLQFPRLQNKHNTLVTLLETISRVDISKPNFTIHDCWDWTGCLDRAFLWSRQLWQLLSNVVVSCKRQSSDCGLWFPVSGSRQGWVPTRWSVQWRSTSTSVDPNDRLIRPWTKVSLSMLSW